MTLAPSPIIALVFFVIPVLISALLLYVVRFGVKHGMRSYYAQADQPPSDQ